jgi:trans-aconitate methyltransferase
MTTPAIAHSLDAQRSAYATTATYRDDQEIMAAEHAERVVRLARARRARTLLSMGIGHKIVFEQILSAVGPQLDRYVVVDGSQAAIDELRRENLLPGNVETVLSYFEEFQSDMRFDVIEAGFVLEHVADPLAVLTRYRELLAPNGVIAIAVPNARSLHRLVGQEAGLLDDVYRLSAADLELGHYRYFDLESITQLVLDAGCRIAAAQGIFLKPVTAAQFAKLELSREVIDAFVRLGRRFPAISNAIYIEATA